MLQQATFDAAAAGYDDEFSRTITGSMQRARVRTWMRKLVAGKPLRILEINCGTGEDALWLADLGHRVIATDASPEMIRVAEGKSNPRQVSFHTCAFKDLRTTFGNEQFDLVFSNFSGLNCVDRQELKTIQQDIAFLLKPSGHLVMVLFGKNCWMERLFFFLKGDRMSMNRRKTRVEARVPGGTQSTWCWSVGEVEQIFEAFRMETARAVGLFIPPSWMEKRVKKVYVPMIGFLEKIFSPFPVFADAGDHVYIAMRKK